MAIVDRIIRPNMFKALCSADNPPCRATSYSDADTAEEADADFRSIGWTEHLFDGKEETRMDGSTYSLCPKCSKLQAEGIIND